MRKLLREIPQAATKTKRQIAAELKQVGVSIFTPKPKRARKLPAHWDIEPIDSPPTAENAAARAHTKARFANIPRPLPPQFQGEPTSPAEAQYRKEAMDRYLEWWG